MYPDTGYAGPRGSFLRPVPIPTHGPNDGGTQPCQVSCDWLPYVRGALYQLLLQSTWATDDPAELLQVQEWVFDLIDQFGEGDCSTGPAFACPFDFTTSEYDWEVYPEFGLGSWVSGQGYETTYNSGANLYQAIIWLDGLSGMTLTSIDMTYDGDGGPGGAGNVNFYYLIPFSSTLHNFAHLDVLTGENTVGWTGVLDVQRALVFELNMGTNATPGKITSIVLNGRAFLGPC